MAKGDGASVAKSTRRERGAWSPHDFGKTNDQPQLGRDVPYRYVNGVPVMDLEYRIESYGEHGLRRETKCIHCRQWLSFPMCRPCQSALRMFGNDDRTCKCFQETQFIYARCEDHRMFQDPLNLPAR